jgi:predicted nuclease with TOPRIM domain
MSRTDYSTEPARQTPYRRLYTRIYKFEDEVKRQDNCISYLLNEIRTLQKRVDELEQRKDKPTELRYFGEVPL